MIVRFYKVIIDSKVLESELNNLKRLKLFYNANLVYALSKTQHWLLYFQKIFLVITFALLYGEKINFWDFLNFGTFGTFSVNAINATNFDPRSKSAFMKA